MTADDKAEILEIKTRLRELSDVKEVYSPREEQNYPTLDDTLGAIRAWGLAKNKKE